jgi:hypothetical protein
MDDKWFRELIKPLPASSAHAHPSRADLRAYLHGRLPDIWRTGAHSPDAWTLTEVSQHLLICEGCAQQLALMRRQELEQVTLPNALRTHIVMYAIVLAALFVLNAFLVMVLPAPVVLRPCGAGIEKAGSAESTESPRALPSAPKVCNPVPAPRPPWQTWWVVWVLLVWTPLLGLHLLWELMGRTIPASRRPAATSLASFISFFL